MVHSIARSLRGTGWHAVPSRLALLSLVLIAAACADSAAPGSPGEPISMSLSGQVEDDSTPSQMAVAALVPGFGGYFLDPSGAPTVYLLDASQRPAAEAALAAFLVSRGFTSTDLVVRHGQYEYTQLDAWYGVARSAAFAVSGIVLGDVDEGKNRLRFGVTSAVAAAQVQSAVAALGVPAGAVVLEQRAPYAPLTTLRERVRPLMGSLQLNFFLYPPNGLPGVSYLCTLGFNAELNGERSFITNSHCTNNEGGTTLPTTYYQSRRSTLDNRVGIEVDDPEWQFSLDTNLRCPPPFQCRWSDAARVRIDDTVAAELGRIARLDEITTTLADTIHTIDGHFSIRGERGPVEGEVVNKVGRTTGWTQGPTLGTCVDVLALETNHIRLCQVQVAALVDGGDSGSPVFWRKGGGPSVALLGILWGGSVDEADPSFTYSPLSGIRRDLGDIRVR